eukprot:784835-Pelagomonas_calceolata.AAC.2
MLRGRHGRRGGCLPACPVKKRWGYVGKAVGPQAQRLQRPKYKTLELVNGGREVQQVLMANATQG